MTIVEKIIIITFIVMAVFFFIDLVGSIILSYLTAKQEVERERKIDYILEHIETEYEDDIFPEFRGDE